MYGKVWFSIQLLLCRKVYSHDQMSQGPRCVKLDGICALICTLHPMLLRTDLHIAPLLLRNVGALMQVSILCESNTAQESVAWLTAVPAKDEGLCSCKLVVSDSKKNKVQWAASRPGFT